MWSCQSLDELQVLSESGARLSWEAVAVIAAGLATIGIAVRLGDRRVKIRRVFPT